MDIDDSIRAGQAGLSLQLVSSGSKIRWHEEGFFQMHIKP